MTPGICSAHSSLSLFLNHWLSYRSPTFYTSLEKRVIKSAETAWARTSDAVRQNMCIPVQWDKQKHDERWKGSLQCIWQGKRDILARDAPIGPILHSHPRTHKNVPIPTTDTMQHVYSVCVQAKKHWKQSIIGIKKKAVYISLIRCIQRNIVTLSCGAQANKRTRSGLSVQRHICTSWLTASL